MNIRDFLIDNYIWIIVVILLSIVTVIGFLADKKKNSKKNQSENNESGVPSGTLNNVQTNAIETPMQPIINEPKVLGNPINLGQPLNTTVTPLNTTMNPLNAPMPTTSLEQPVIQPMNQNSAIEQAIPNQINNYQSGLSTQNINIAPSSPITPPTEVLNTATTVTPEPMYQPLSEQKPVIAPREVIIPQSVNPMPINNQVANQSETVINNNMMGANTNIPQYTTPTPVNPMPIPAPTPQVVNPIPNPNEMPQVATTPTNLQMQSIVDQSMQNTNQMPQQVGVQQPSNPQPVNFVFGPQGNSNQNM